MCIPVKLAGCKSTQPAASTWLATGTNRGPPRKQEQENKYGQSREPTNINIIARNTTTLSTQVQAHYSSCPSLSLFLLVLNCKHNFSFADLKFRRKPFRFVIFGFFYNSSLLFVHSQNITSSHCYSCLLFSGSLSSISFWSTLSPIWSELVVVKQFSVLDKTTPNLLFTFSPIHPFCSIQIAALSHLTSPSSLVRSSFFVIFNCLPTFFLYLHTRIHSLASSQYCTHTRTYTHTHSLTHSLDSSFTCTHSHTGKLATLHYSTLHYIHLCTHQSSFLAQRTNVPQRAIKELLHKPSDTSVRIYRNIVYRIFGIPPPFRPSILLFPSFLFHPSFSSFLLFLLSHTHSLTHSLLNRKTKEPFGTQSIPHSYSHSPSICIKVMAPMVVFFFVFSHPLINKQTTILKSTLSTLSTLSTPPTPPN